MHVGEQQKFLEALWTLPGQDDVQWMCVDVR